MSKSGNQALKIIILGRKNIRKGAIKAVIMGMERILKWAWIATDNEEECEEYRRQSPGDSQVSGHSDL